MRGIRVIRVANVAVVVASDRILRDSCRGAGENARHGRRSGEREEDPLRQKVQEISAHCRACKFLRSP